MGAHERPQPIDRGVEHRVALGEAEAGHVPDRVVGVEGADRDGGDAGLNG